MKIFGGLAILLSVLIVILSCKPHGHSVLLIPYSLDPSYEFPYGNGEVAEISNLPLKLNEVSGIHFLGDNLIAAVQDEKGKIYVYDLVKGEIVNNYNYVKQGDYEDLEIIGDKAFLLRSDGRIVSINGWDSEDPEVIKFNTPFTAKNNCEGLCFDKGNNNLLVALKGRPGFNKTQKKRPAKAIYSLSPETMQVSDEPFLEIDTEWIDEIYKKVHSEDGFIKFSENLIGQKVNFKPSGIAIHPESNNVYVISNTAFMILVYSPTGDLLALVRLDPKVFRQAEGICFDQQANLYISNEGIGGSANIVKIYVQQ